MVSENKEIKIKVSRRSARWVIRNRFLGFFTLFCLAFICLIVPKAVEESMNGDYQQ